MSKKNSSQNIFLGKYKSAADIPSITELIQSLEAYKTLDAVFGSGQATKIKQLEEQLNEMIASVDGFYDLLGDKNWIFHEDLNYENVKTILKNNSGADDAEKQLINLYAEESLKLMLYKANWLEASRGRLGLIEKAKKITLKNATTHAYWCFSQSLTGL